MENLALEKIKQLVAEQKSQLAVARMLEITPSYLNDILNGRRDVSANVAMKLGFWREIHYVHIPVLGEFTGHGDEIGKLLQTRKNGDEEPVGVSK